MLFLLDIDGVMVPAKSWKSPEFLNDDFPAFSNKATTALQQSISVGDTIVLTTSHKANFTIEEWKSIFNNRGIVIEKIISLPNNLNGLSRKDEIANWFNVNSIEENFVIIDDDKSLNELPVFLKANLVQTSPIVGLTEEHVPIIKSILSKDFQPVL
jgi:hypothetical protein